MCLWVWKGGCVACAPDLTRPLRPLASPSLTYGLSLSCPLTQSTHPQGPSIPREAAAIATPFHAHQLPEVSAGLPIRTCRARPPAGQPMLPDLPEYHLNPIDPPCHHPTRAATIPSRTHSPQATQAIHPLIAKTQRCQTRKDKLSEPETQLHQNGWPQNPSANVPADNQKAIALTTSIAARQAVLFWTEKYQMAGTQFVRVATRIYQSVF